MTYNSPLTILKDIYSCYANVGVTSRLLIPPVQQLFDEGYINGTPVVNLEMGIPGIIDITLADKGKNLLKLWQL